MAKIDRTSSVCARIVCGIIGPSAVAVAVDVAG
jgi:hypothetical protein